MASAIHGYLIDLDGTVYTEDGPIPGAAGTIGTLRQREIPFRFFTNTTRRSRTDLARRMREYGIEVSPDEILTAPRAAMAWLHRNGMRRIALYLPAETHGEFAGIEQDHEHPEAVVVGDLGDDWTVPLLNRAFRQILNGARLLALQKNPYWRPHGELVLDAGPYVAALEYATGQTAVVAGKPNPAFFRAAAEAIELPLQRLAVVGDDLRTDIAGAKAVGATAVLVRTGKYRNEDLADVDVAPDRVIDSIAHLMA